jgi:hypothetical protein
VGFEGGGRELEEGGEAQEIVFGDVDEAILVAAADAAGLALEAEGAAQTVIGQICFGCVWQG